MYMKINIIKGKDLIFVCLFVMDKLTNYLTDCKELHTLSASSCILFKNNRDLYESWNIITQEIKNLLIKSLFGVGCEDY